MLLMRQDMKDMVLMTLKEWLNDASTGNNPTLQVYFSSSPCHLLHARPITALPPLSCSYVAAALVPIP